MVGRSLRLPFRLFYGEFSTLEADLAVSAVAERFVDGAAAAAKRECRLASQIIGSAVGIDQFDRTFRSFNAKRAIGANSDLHLSHRKSSNLTGF